MPHLTPLVLTSFTVNLPDWLFSVHALIVFLVGLLVGLVLGRVRR